MNTAAFLSRLRSIAPQFPQWGRLYRFLHDLIVAIGGIVNGMAGISSVCFVDPAAPGPGTRGSLVDKFNTIQDAVDAALEGDVIRVAPGSYDENVTVHKSLTFDGWNVDGSDQLGWKLAPATGTSLTFAAPAGSRIEVRGAIVAPLDVVADVVSLSTTGPDGAGVQAFFVDCAINAPDSPQVALSINNARVRLVSSTVNGDVAGTIPRSLQLDDSVINGHVTFVVTGISALTGTPPLSLSNGSTIAGDVVVTGPAAVTVDPGCKVTGGIGATLTSGGGVNAHFNFYGAQGSPQTNTGTAVNILFPDATDPARSVVDLSGAEIYGAPFSLATSGTLQQVVKAHGTKFGGDGVVLVNIGDKVTLDTRGGGYLPKEGVVPEAASSAAWNRDFEAFNVEYADLAVGALTPVVFAVPWPANTVLRFSATQRRGGGAAGTGVDPSIDASDETGITLSLLTAATAAGSLDVHVMYDTTAVP